MQNNGKAFIVSPIGDPGSDVRRNADLVLRHLIEPACAVNKLEAVRADQLADSGLVTHQVIQHLVDDQIVIADLSGGNPNVFYELAIRHAVKKPYVQIVRIGDSRPFDVAGIRTITYNLADPDSVSDARDRIRALIEAFIQGAPVESPISLALEMHQLIASNVPQEKHIGDVLKVAEDLRIGLAGLDGRLRDLLGAAGLSVMREAVAMQIRDCWRDLVAAYARIQAPARVLDELRSIFARTLFLASEAGRQECDSAEREAEIEVLKIRVGRSLDALKTLGEIGPGYPLDPRLPS